MASQQSIAAATKAVQADNAGNVALAVQWYTEAVRCIRQDAVGRPAAEQEAFSARANQYAQRAEVLRNQQVAASLPQVPQAMVTAASNPALVGAGLGAAHYAAAHPEHASRANAAVQSGSAAVKRGGGFQSVATTAAAGAAGGLAVGAMVVGAPITMAVAGAAGAGYMATRDDKRGEVARAFGDTSQKAYHGVRDFNNTHGVTTKIAAGTGAVYRKTVDVNNEYDVTGKASAAASYTWNGAKKINQDYKVVDTASDLASKGVGLLQQGFQGAKAADQEYKITDTVAGAASGAWASTKKFNEDYQVTDKVATNAAVLGKGISNAFGSLWGSSGSLKGSKK